MAKFGKTSLKRLQDLDSDLREILEEAIKIMDFSVLCTFRTKEAQNKAFNEGKSKLQYPESNHNTKPSLAVDVAPYPIDWEDLNRFERLCGIIEGIALMKGIKIRMGRDFSFNDYPHIEKV